MRHSGPISALAIVDANRLATGSYDGGVALYDLTRRTYTAHHRAHHDLVTSVSATSGTVFSGGADRQLCVSAIVGAALLPGIAHPFDDDVEALLALDDTTAVVGLGDGSIHLVRTLDHEVAVTELTRQRGTITALRSSGDGRIVVAGNDGTVRILTLVGSTVTDSTTVLTSEMPIKNTLILPDGRIVAGGHDGRLVVLDIEGDVTVVRSFPSSVRGLAATNGHLYVGCYDGDISKFILPELTEAGFATVGATRGEIWTRQLISTPTGKVFSASMNGLPVGIDGDVVQATSNLNCAAAMPPTTDGVAVVGADDGQLLVVTHTNDGLGLLSNGSVGECVTSVAVDAGGTIAACTWSGGVHVDGHLLAHLDQPLLGLAWLGNQLVVGDYQGQVHRIGPDGIANASAKALPSSTKRIAVAGDLVLVVGRYGPAAVIDATTFAIISTLEIDCRVCDAVAVSPSGALVAFAAGPNEIWIFSTSELTPGPASPLVRLPGHTKPPKDAAWATDDIVFTTGYDSTVIRHDLATGTASTVNLSNVAETGLVALISATVDLVLAVAFDGTIHEVGFSG